MDKHGFVIVKGGPLKSEKATIVENMDTTQDNIEVNMKASTVKYNFNWKC